VALVGRRQLVHAAPYLSGIAPRSGSFRDAAARAQYDLGMRRLAMLCFVCATVHADPAPNRIEVAVGKTVEKQVGVLRTYFCDNPSLISAQLVTRGGVNVWVVTGVKPGTTQCRVGESFRPSLLFDVVVTDSE
jgi:hypothetical protein